MNIEELKRQAKAATPGPWVAWPIGDYPPLFSIATETGLGLLTTTTEAENEREFAAVFEDEDAAFIAAANPATILELIEEIGYLRGKNHEHFDAAMGCDEELKRVTRQRDELLAAAKLMVDWLDAENDHSKEPDFYKRMEMCIRAEESARAAIAKVEG